MKDHRQATVGTTLFSVASGQNRLISLTVVRLRRLTQSVTRVLTLNGRISEYVLFAALLVLLTAIVRSEEHTSELQSQSNLVCRLLLEKKKSHDVSLTSVHTVD